MADKGFGVKKINLIGASGTPTLTSPNNRANNLTNPLFCIIHLNKKWCKYIISEINRQQIRVIIANDRLINNSMHLTKNLFS